MTTEGYLLAPITRVQMIREGEISSRPILAGPADAAALLIPLIRDEPQEVLVVITVTTKMRVLGICEVYRGCIDSSPVRLAEIFRPAILQNAAGIFIAHNHPSGDPTPSAADARVTREIAEVGRSLGLPLHDHLIIGESGWISMRERGFIAA
jgi:DNA repair protein RadC